MTLRNRLAAAIVVVLLACVPPVESRQTTVERWGIYEIALNGPSTGNPFLDHTVNAVFTSGPNTVTVPGFYDGEGRYLIRFMPDRLGAWSYRTSSTPPALNDHAGTFSVVAPSAGNRGPVHTARTFHFDYADGTPYRPLGTTVYAWIHQPTALQEQTLRTLAGAP